jgi:hypothetical protein
VGLEKIEVIKPIGSFNIIAFVIHSKEYLPLALSPDALICVDFFAFALSKHPAMQLSTQAIPAKGLNIQGYRPSHISACQADIDNRGP